MARRGAAEPRLEVWSGALEARLAESDSDLDAAQALRYRVFYDEMGARPTDEMARIRRDFDRLDPYCDHLLVVDHARGGEVVGTYRLIRRPVAQCHGGFYSAAEYDIAAIEAHPGEVLELGRSCVDAASRNRPTMQLLWRGIAGYVFAHDIALMFGCASLPGIDPDALAVPLSYLYHHHLAPPDLRPRALPGRYVEMRRLERDRFVAARALAGLPPLIKGYLRLGGFVGDGAVIDHQFNTTDVCIVVRTDLVTDKYYRHYERQAREDVAS
ncbi:MAG TPA: GNAT family N-acyltransferase [Stellaceae bacterium]|nr:GNAT family N-acyltransferase [Stellaceae bacterium]